MSELSLFALLKTLLKYAVAPFALIAWFFFKKHTQETENKFSAYESRTSILERRVNDIDRRQAVLETKLDFILHALEKAHSAQEKILDRLDKSKHG